MSHSVTHPVGDIDIKEIERQVRWEMAGVQRGADRVREQMENQTVADSDVGQKIMRRLAPPLVERIREAQKFANETLIGRGNHPPWCWFIVLVKAEELAVITLRAILGAKPRDFTFNPPLTSVAMAIGADTQTQIEFESWRIDQKEKDPEDNEFLQYLNYNRGVVDERSFNRFREKINLKREKKWERRHRLSFGVMLIECLIDAVPDFFSVETVRIKAGKTEKQIIFSDEAKELIGDLTEQCELSRPMMLPMICQPAEWRMN